jgi:hypothetical protein
MLGDLAATTRWVPGIVTARMEGMRRICRTQEGSEIVEDISNYSEEARSWSYRQLRVPVPIRNSRGTLKVLAEGHGSLVVWDAEFDPLDPRMDAEVTVMMSGFYDQTLALLRKCVEEGAQ